MFVAQNKETTKKDAAFTKKICNPSHAYRQIIDRMHFSSLILLITALYNINVECCNKQKLLKLKSLFLSLRRRLKSEFT